VFELRAFHSCKADPLLLDPHLWSIFALVILEMGSPELFAQAGLELLPSQSQPPK
jgi:hypothetical protein